MPRVIAIIAAMFFCPSTWAATETLKVQGNVLVSTDLGRTWKNLRKEAMLKDGVVIKTERGAFADIRFKDGSLMRVTERSSVRIDKAEQKGKDFEIQIDLKIGRICAIARDFGNASKLGTHSAGSRFEIKSPLAVAGIRRDDTSFDISSSGVLRCAYGALDILYVVGGNIPFVTVRTGERIHPPATRMENPENGKRWLPEGESKELNRDLSDQRESAMRLFAGNGPIRRTEVEILKLKGDVSISSNRTRTWKTATRKDSLKANSLIKAGVGALADLRLEDGSLIRVTEKTTVGIDKADKQGKVVEWQIDLKQGRICVIATGLEGFSKFEIKTPVCVAGVRRREASFDGNASGLFRCVEGRVVAVYVVNGPVLPPINLRDGEQFQYPPLAGEWRTSPEKIPDDDLKKLGAEFDELRESARKSKGKRR